MKFLCHATTRLFRLFNKSKCVFRAFLLSVAFVSLAFTSAAIASTQDEYRVKAAFIYNFVAFTQWPNFVELNEFNMCIYGTDYFGHEITALEEKTVNHLSISIKRINRLDEIKQCQTVYISHSHDDQLPVILDSIKTQPILTITDSPNAATLGVMINMHLVQNKVKFEINLKSARNAGLNISSRLLQLATQVYQ